MPQNYAIDVKVPRQSRRKMMLISKVIQNIANGVNFKEDYMVQLNPFVAKMHPRVREVVVSLDESGEKLAMDKRHLIWERAGGDGSHKFVESIQTVVAFLKEREAKFRKAASDPKHDLLNDLLDVVASIKLPKGEAAPCSNGTPSDAKPASFCCR